METTVQNAYWSNLEVIKLLNKPAMKKYLIFISFSILSIILSACHEKTPDEKALEQAGVKNHEDDKYRERVDKMKKDGDEGTKRLLDELRGSGKSASHENSKSK
jgi:outer membrane PBP1 activator LpoA protein